MNIKGLKKFGFHEKIVYKSEVECLPDGRRVTTETPVGSYFWKKYEFYNGWVQRKVIVAEDESTPGVWNVEVSLDTRDGLDSVEFQSTDSAKDLLLLLTEHTKGCGTIEEL